MKKKFKDSIGLQSIIRYAYMHRNICTFFVVLIAAAAAAAECICVI